ncbi:PrpF domain-containing protein [Alicyclobacillus mengziensis]|uniref:PrpF protein n=1 Tax=Alicyclobacillus mengziensis TaxID=2931921 RepID=A0A9X7VUN8_9BACL|nr:PrpF domain-containing protein [Alicyclobacillus mengziensis]QSO45549.1 PrpF protein [Alicyclobacillus mengziensis]
MEWTSVPCSIYRGGTSKGLLLRGQDLPQDPQIRDQLILYLFGSPDAKQVNGLGGATPTTSKLGIVEASKRSDADVDYTFGQVSIDTAFIDYRPNCGNVSSAIGPFALEQGIVRANEDGWTSVRIYNTNTDSIIVSRFMVKDGHFVPDGDTKIPGVPGTGSPIYLDFFDAGGSVTGKLFPTGSRLDEIKLSDGRKFHVTVIDIGNLTILMDSDELSLQGIEVSEQQIAHVLPTMEQVRQHIGRMLELFRQGEVVSPTTHALPKIAVVQSPKDYKSSDETYIQSKDYDIAARVLTMGRLHPTYAVTGGMALTVSSKFSGTISHYKSSVSSRDSKNLRIGHPAGILEMQAEVTEHPLAQVSRVTLIRTARPLITGLASVPVFREVVS